MTEKLEMPLEQFAKAVAKENARLTEEIERLNKDLRLSIMSDTEYCALLEKENEQLRQTLQMGTATQESEKIYKLIVDNERLISGPGGIMEMKQTIADKETRIDKLETTMREIIWQARQYEIPPTVITLMIVRMAEEALK
jgi:hypothetical protein